VAASGHSERLAEGDEVAMAAPVLAARSVSKSFGAVDALTSASIEVRSGEVVGLVGDNGAGKSTLVKILSGVLAPDDGWVEIENRPARLQAATDAHRLGIETVYQDLALAPHLTPEENLYLGRELLWGPSILGFGLLRRKEMRRHCSEAMRQIGIELPSKRTPISALSGGQKQAVEAARMLHWARKAVILDEPTAALGVHQSEIVMQTISTIAERGLAVIVVTHDLPRLLAVADRIVVLRLGQVIAERPASAFTVTSLALAIMGAEATDE
jgi:simple sugar transport system ATP-binding protein